MIHKNTQAQNVKCRRLIKRRMAKPKHKTQGRQSDLRVRNTAFKAHNPPEKPRQKEDGFKLCNKIML